MDMKSFFSDPNPGPALALILIPDPGSCSGQKTPESWGRLSEALGNLGSGNLEGEGLGKGVGQGGVSLQATW
jgi:hypothetical protein